MRVLARGNSKAGGGLTAVVALAALSATALALTGCAPAGTSASTTDPGTTTDTIKIGYISPVTGAYAGFSDGDAFMLSVVRDQFADGIEVGGKTYQVEILDRDSGSDPAKAGELAQQLITKDNVDLVLATSTPETTNPVIAQCEANATPCLTTIAPWQAVVFGGGFSPDKPMKWSHHFFFGIEGFGNVEPAAWDQVETNKKVGVLWANDADGGAFRDPANGYGPFVEKAGYTLVDPGPYENGNQDFTSIIQTFKDQDVQIIAGVPIPPDFVTFWTQAAQQGFKPKIATIGKALFFPATVPSIPNDLGEGLAFTTWWGPTFPYKSSFGGTTPEQWISNFEASPEGAGLSWNQATPDNESLFELASAAFTASGDPHDKAAVNKAIDGLNMMTLAGPVDFTSGPFPGVSAMETALGQWQKNDDGSWEWVVVDAGTVAGLTAERPLEPIK